jgi:hypothetical protein
MTIRVADSLGIPHFQRGTVWGDDSVALLLESLYDGNTCGTLMVWSPPDAAQRGVAITANGEPMQLLVDGQQRVTALIDVFAPEMLLGRAKSSQEPTKIWCLNVDRTGKGRRIDLFHRDTHPGAGGRYASALVPLAWLLSTDEGWNRAYPDLIGRTERAIENGWAKRLHEMRDVESFTVEPLDESRVCRQNLRPS